MAKCKHCGTEITWIKQDGKWIPANASTGEIHFQECKRIKFKRSGRPTVGKPVLVIGENYKPSGCDCDIPPWEICKHSFHWMLDEQDVVLAALDRIRS